jgi:hypothetical protein
MLRVLSRSAAAFKPAVPLKFVDGKANLYFDSTSKMSNYLSLSSAVMSGGLFAYILLHHSVLSYPILGSQLAISTLMGSLAYGVSRFNKSNVKSLSLLECGSVLEVVYNSHIGFEYTALLNINSIIDISALKSTAKRESSRVQIFLVKPKRHFWLYKSQIKPEHSEILQAILREGRVVQVEDSISQKSYKQSCE